MGARQALSAVGHTAGGHKPASCGAYSDPLRCDARAGHCGLRRSIAPRRPADRTAVRGQLQLPQQNVFEHDARGCLSHGRKRASRRRTSHRGRIRRIRCAAALFGSRRRSGAHRRGPGHPAYPYGEARCLPTTAYAGAHSGSYGYCLDSRQHAHRRKPQCAAPACPCRRTARLGLDRRGTVSRAVVRRPRLFQPQHRSIARLPVPL